MDKIWISNYPKGVAAEINDSDIKSINEIFKTAVKNYKDKDAFENFGTSITYTELDELSDQFASYLLNVVKLEKGDRIAIQLPNLLQYPICIFGAIKAGLIVVNTNPLYTQREMKHQFKDSGVKAIVILNHFTDKLEGVIKDTSIEHVIETGVGDLLGFPKSLALNLILKYVKKSVVSHNLEVQTFRSALNEGKALLEKTTFPKVDKDDIAFLQYTGGTTGVAKGAELTHKNIVANMLQIVEWMKPSLTAGKEKILTPLPLYHIFSLTVNALGLLYYGGTNILITNPRDIPAFIKLMRKRDFTLLSAVNTLFNALMNHEEFKNVDFSSLKLSVAGGMALQTSVGKRWEEITGTPAIEGYGLTETSPVSTCNPIDGNDRPGTIGLPLPSTDIKIILEDGSEAKDGEDGEICIKGPHVMKGYWNRPEETKNAFTEDGWFKTGDMARHVGDGFFKIVDRKKDMILVSGFNVYPNEIEDVVAEHEKVLEVAAVGVEDPSCGEAVKIFVVKKDNSLTKEELLAYCKENLTGYKRPSHIEFREELPKTNVGKILRRKLKEEKSNSEQMEA